MVFVFLEVALPPTGQRAHTATLLATTNAQLNNKVLLVGGNNGTSTIASALLFDPAQSAFSTLASMSTPRESHTTTPLANGKLLGGGGKNGSAALASTAIFDPGFGPGSWSNVGSLVSARESHTATLLPDGRVLVAGGKNGSTTLAETPTVALPTPRVSLHPPAIAPSRTKRPSLTWVSST